MLGEGSLLGTEELFLMEGDPEIYVLARELKGCSHMTSSEPAVAVVSGIADL